MLRLPGFEYIAAKNIQEACSLLEKYDGKAKILAGGTDLLVKMKQGLEKYACLVSLNNLHDLKAIAFDEENGLRIGALASLSSLADSPIVNQRFGILGQALRTLASRQVRNRGTVGGNLCNASPAGDTAPALMGLDSRAVITGLNGERYVPLDEFFAGPGRTVLKTDEILTEVQVPNPLPHTGGAFLKLSARERDLAVVSVAAVIVLEPGKPVCRDIRIILGAVGPVPIRAFKVEEMLKGNALDEAAIQAGAQAASDAAKPISDVRASAEYRREMLVVLAKRALKGALEAAK